MSARLIASDRQRPVVFRRRSDREGSSTDDAFSFRQRGWLVQGPAYVRGNPSHAVRTFGAPLRSVQSVADSREDPRWRQHFRTEHRW